MKTILSSEFDPPDKAGSLRDFWCKGMRFTTALYTYVQRVQLCRDLYRDFKIVIMYNYRMNPVSVALHVKSLAHDRCIINVTSLFLILMLVWVLLCIILLCISVCLVHKSAQKGSKSSVCADLCHICVTFTPFLPSCASSTGSRLVLVLVRVAFPLLVRHIITSP